MKTTLTRGKRSILIWLTTLSLSVLSHNIFAGNLQTSVIVGCTVTKTSSSPLKILEAPLNTTSAAGLLKDINIRCPAGSAVTVSVQTQSSEMSSAAQLENCPLPPIANASQQSTQNSCPNTPHYHFYKDSSCTVIWNQDEEMTFIPDTKHPARAPAIYSKFCKKNPGDISLKQGESVTILTITLEY